jgi:type I pantothenate kinase
MNVAPIVEVLAARRPAAGTFVVGVTGSVASGKSTLAAALAPALADLAGRPVLAGIATDGFLFPNSVLAERGLEMRKGYPESYDLAALASVLGALRRGPAFIPAYSHVTYDIDPAAATTLGRPDILIVEGLALGLDLPVAAGAASLVDCLIYIDADEADLEAWFTARFMNFWREAEHDPASFYRRFRALDAVGAQDVARRVWTGINLPNLRQNIAPVRALADLVVRKGPDHAVTALIAQGRPA